MALSFITVAASPVKSNSGRVFLSHGNICRQESLVPPAMSYTGSQRFNLGGLHERSKRVSTGSIMPDFCTSVSSLRSGWVGGSKKFGFCCKSSFTDKALSLFGLFGKELGKEFARMMGKEDILDVYDNELVLLELEEVTPRMKFVGYLIGRNSKWLEIGKCKIYVDGEPVTYVGDLKLGRGRVTCVRNLADFEEDIYFNAGPDEPKERSIEEIYNFFFGERTPEKDFKKDVHFNREPLKPGSSIEEIHAYFFGENKGPEFETAFLKRKGVKDHN